MMHNKIKTINTKASNNIGQLMNRYYKSIENKSHKDQRYIQEIVILVSSRSFFDLALYPFMALLVHFLTSHRKRRNSI
jgi:hypothetical protein